MSVDLITKIFEICIIPMLGAITCFLVKWIKVKADEIAVRADSELADKYIGMFSDTITKCVIATNQTYVDALKKSGRFDVEAQKEAFEMTYTAVLDSLGDDLFDYVSEFVGDFNKYLEECIEFEVNKNK